MDEKTKEQKEDEIKKTSKIPITTLRRILKEQGIEKISKEALEEVNIIIHNIIIDLSRKIIIATRHRKAKISDKSDVNLALR